MVKRIPRQQLFRSFSSQDDNRDIIYDIDTVKRDLLNHFHTRIGERVMMPEFGCIIWDLLFEPFTEGVIIQIQENIQEIVDFDSRIRMSNLIIDDFEHGIVIQMDLQYVPFDVFERFTMEFDKRTIDSADGSILQGI